MDCLQAACYHTKPLPHIRLWLQRWFIQDVTSSTGCFHHSASMTLWPEVTRLNVASFSFTILTTLQLIWLVNIWELDVDILHIFFLHSPDKWTNMHLFSPAACPHFVDPKIYTWIDFSPCTNVSAGYLTGTQPVAGLNNTLLVSQCSPLSLIQTYDDFFSHQGKT